jgi:hypothetical protein
MRFPVLPRAAKAVFWAGGLASLTVLSGCTTTAEQEQLAAISCPRTAILAQAATLTRFGAGAVQNPANAATKATMSQPTLDCSYNSGEGRVSVDVTIPVRITGQGTAIAYFVAVLDSAGNIVSKEIFSANVGSDEYRELSVDDRVITLGQGKRPYDYQILTGFQLSAAELAYNQAQRNYRP